MIIFFNHVFKKRLNEEPSPLEVEMFNYQQDLDRYVVMHENKESMSRKLMIIKSLFIIFIGLSGGLSVGAGYVAFLTVLRNYPKINTIIENNEND